MKRLSTSLLSIGLAIGLSACSVDSDQNTSTNTTPTTPDASANNPSATTKLPPSGRSLDLTIPSDKLSPEQLAEKLIAAEEDKLPNLFEKENKEKRLTIEGKPSFVPGEQLTDMPTVDGAEVSVEIKID